MQGSDIGEKRDLVCDIVNGEEEETNLPSQCDAYGKSPPPCQQLSSWRPMKRKGILDIMRKRGEKKIKMIL
eukprot:4413116-Ditylum_brightwellii.AAC.1